MFKLKTMNKMRLLNSEKFFLMTGILDIRLILLHTVAKSLGQNCLH